MERDTLGRLALIILVLALFYDVIFGLYKFAVESSSSLFTQLMNFFDSLIVSMGGGNPTFPTTEKLMNDIFSWEVFLFTNAMSLAVILFIDVIKMAFRGR